jgi:hypothetical protein
MLCAVRLSRGEVTDLLRSVGGVLFALGTLVLVTRKSTWSSGVRLLVISTAVVVLYVLALGLLERSSDGVARPWQSVLMVTALLLGPVALFQFLDWVGADTGNLFFDAAVFAITGLLAVIGAQRARAPYAALLAGLSLLISWVFLWAKIIHDPSANTVRWLLVGAAVLLLAVAYRLLRRGAIGAAEVASAGGIAAVAAGVMGVVVGFVRGLSPIVTINEGSAKDSPFGHRPAFTSGVQHLGWDVYLLVVSLALVWLGSHARVRGLGYIGGFGLTMFVLSVGSQITQLEVGRSPSTHITGWPIVLLTLGLAGLALSFLDRPAAAEPRPTLE